MNATSAYGWSDPTPSYSQSYLEPVLLWLLRERKARKVIDLGCGNAVTVRVLCAAGYETVGCEPDLQGFEIARRQATGAKSYNVGV